MNFADILGDKTAMKLLAFLIKNSDKNFCVSELMTKLDVSRVTLSKKLKLLEKQKFVNSVSRGKINFYKINSENPWIKELKIILNLSEVISRLRDLPENTEAYLFGSAARGEDGPDSDFDILIISEHSSEQIISCIKLHDGREINPLIMKPFEYVRLSKKDPALYKRIERDKIKVRGG